MDTKILELIKVVNNNYNHIQQLETLVHLLKEKFPEEHVVAKTTMNSHYKYRLWGHKKFQHPENHIDSFFAGKIAVDKPLVTGMDDHEISYPSREHSVVQLPGSTQKLMGQIQNNHVKGKQQKPKM